MKHSKNIFVIAFILLFIGSAKSQIYDNYGMKAGAGLSTQYWKYDNSGSGSLSDNKDFKLAPLIQVYAEKNLGEFFVARASFGYIQKGFRDELSLRADDNTEIGVVKNRVVLNDLSLDVSYLFIPMQTSIQPYLSVGCRSDLLLSYRSVVLNYEEENIDMGTDLYDNFKRVTFGGLLSVGVLYEDYGFAELEFNPAITSNYDKYDLEINDTYFSLTIGVNINKILAGDMAWKKAEASEEIP